MMRTHKVRTLMAAAALCCIGLFTTCKNTVGLGGTVDINPPTLDVSTIYPPAGAVIRDTFVLSIEAKDDSGIASVTANLTKTGLTEQPDSKYTSYSLEKAADGTHWTAHINKKDTEKGFPLTDGSYKVLLTATDTAGKTARTESTFTIDNTAPLLILNRPSTTTNDDSSDMFGDGFLLVGQVYDDTPVAALTVTAKGTGEHDPVFTKSIAHVPQNIRLTVDAFSIDSMKKFYQGLYGSNQNAGPKSYTYNITVEDEAKVYQAPGDKGSGSGNTTNRYYLFDELYREVLSEYRIQTVYNMMRGTYSSQTEVGVPRSAAEIEADQKKTAAVQAALQKAQLGGNVKRQGTFSLNPSLNPRFDIAGEIPVARPEAGGAPKFSRLYSGSTLTVKVSSNLDGVPLESADSYRFFLMEWQKFADFAGGLAYPTDKINGDSIYADAGRTTVKPEFIKLTKSKAEKEGSSYIFSVPVSAEDSGLTYGKSYVLLVRGKDQGGKNKQPNELIPDFKGVRGGVYGFSLVKTGKAPEVFVTQINDTVGTGADGTITERVYLKKGDSLKFKIKLQPITARVTYTLQGDVGGDVSEAQTYTAGEHDVMIDKAKFNQDADGTYKLTVKAEADEGSSLEQTYTIVYDVKGPEVRIAYPVGNLFGDDGTSLVIKGTAFDTGSGLAANPVTVSLTATDGGPAPAVVLAENGENWTSQSIPLPEGEYTLTVTAKDKLGQQQPAEPLIFIYDKADPDIQAVKLIEIDSSNIEVKTHTDTRDTVYSKHTKVKVTGNIVETYGLKKFTINGVPITPIPDSSFSWDTSLSEGSYNIEIKAKDKADKDGSYTVKVVVDTTPPEFEHLKFANVDASSALITTSENPIKITGTIKDSISGRTVSGVKEVYYAVTANTASAPADTSTDWKQLNGKFDNNSIDYILNGFVEINSNDEQKLHIKAVDNAGNEKLFSQKVKVVPAAVIAWNLELKNNTSPSGTVKYNAGKWYAKGQFKVKIGGTSNPVPTDDTIDVKIKKKDASDIIVPTDFFDDWTGKEPKISITDASKKYTVKSGLADGTYTITIKASNNQEQSLEFMVDGTPPTITPAASGDGALPADNAWVSTKALSVSGTAADATSGIEKIEAIVNSGTPKLLGTESPWSGYLTLAEGDNTVQFRVTDKAGNYAETTPRTIKVDINPPTIGLTTPANGQALIKDSTSKVFAKVNVSDSGGSNIQKVEYATSIDFVGATDKTPSNGAAEIELTNINSNTTYYFRAVDNAGNKSDSVQVRVQKDNKPPTVEFESHQNDAKVNKKIKIRGSAGDTRELASVKIVNVTTGTDADLVGVSGSSGADSGKAEFTGTLAYSWHFDLDTTQYSDNADLKLKAIATDAAGNQTIKELTLKVNQDSDRSVVTINSFDHLHAAKLAGTRKISGVIEDDDGAVKKVEIKIGNEGYVDAVMSAGNTLWSIEVPASVGDNSAINFKIKVTDAKDSVFESSNEQANEQALKQPKLSGEKDTNTIGTDFTFVLDTQPPEIMKDGVRYTLGASYGTDEKVLASNEVIGNKNSKKFSIRVFAYDKSGIGSVSVKLGTAAVKTGAHTSASDITAADGKKFEAWDITDIDLTEEGAVKLEITVKDTSGFGKEWSETIRTDFTEPTIKKTAPTDDTVAFKDMTIVGEFTDIPGKPGIAVAGIVPDSLMYHIGNSGWVKKHEANGKVLSELTKAGSTWEIKINDFSEYKTQGATAPTLPSKIWKITLKLKGKDAAGNEVESTGYTLQFDPDGSTPMIEILSPHNDDKLGTGVTISGIARTANPAATDKVTKIKLKLRKSDGTSLTIGTDNYGTGVDIVSKSDINFWSYTLPQNVVTKILDEKKDAEVFFQVQGVAGSTTGDWTVERKFSISKDVAQFSEIKLNEETYAPVSKWIKGNTFHITGEITHSSGIVSATTSSTNLPSGVQALQGAGTKSWFTDITNGKKFDIPIDTTQYLEKAGEIEFTISAKDGRTDGTAKEVFTTIRLKYDNSTPLASIGKIGLSKYNDKANKADFTGGVFTDFVGVIKDTNRELYTVMVNQKKYAVSSIVKEGDNYKVTLDNASSLNGTGLYYMIVKKYDIISGANFKFEGSVEDSGSGPVKIEAELTIAGTTGKAEAQATSKNEAGNLYSFSGNLDTTTVSNGKGTLKITVTDGAGNQTSEAIPVRVKNNPLKINKITFNTDLSGDGNYGASTDEVHVPSLPTDSLTDGDYRCTIDVSSVFAYKNKSKSELVIELIGGYGSSRTVKLYKGSIHADNEVTSGTGTTTQPNVITLNLNGCFANENEASTTLKNKIGDKADQKLILVVTDEVAGNPKPWYAQMDITVAVDVKDDVQPTGYIMPMYYNSKTDNSVGKTIEWEDSEETTVKSMTEHGHIEYSKIASINNDYQSLSGKVVLRGIAYDNIRLSKIELTGADTNISNTYESGAWKPTSNLKIVSEKIMNTGHYVEWEYVWDTGTPEKAHEITVKVTDAAGKTNDSGAEAPADLTGTRETDLKVFVVNKDTVKKGQFISFADGESLYVVQVTEVTAKDGAPTKEKLRWEKVNGNSKRDVPSALTSGKLYAGTSQKKSEKFNIVPYVTSLARGSKYNTNRSTSGAYNIMRKDPNAVSTNPNTGLVTVTGYNLKGIVTATIPGVASSQSVSENAGVFTFTVPSDAKSGSVTITANSIAAINNQTNNSREYNKQNKPNRPETDLWTDDIAIDVWDDDTTANEFPGSKNPVYPSMAMGSNGSLYAAFSNYSESKVYYSKLGESAATQVFYAYDPPEEAAISVSGTDTVNILYSANYHGGTPSNWAQAVTGAGGLYCYDEHAQEIIFNGSGYNAKKGKFHRFELFYHNKQLQQFKNFRIVRGGNDRIHIAYYDTLSNAIKYATVMNNANPHDKNHEYPWINLDGGSDSDDTKSYTGGASAVLSEANYETDGTKKRAGSTAEHCTIALDNGNKPVVVYADIDTGTLRLARASSAAPTAASDWKVQKVLAAGDSNAGLASDYFTAKIDSSGYLHIAFRNTRGQLCYVKSTNAPTGGAAYAFATSEIIDDSGLWADLTLDGTTPYISYMSKPNAYDGIRIAYFDNNLVKTWNNDGTEKDKGGWNKVTVALQNRANNVRTCIAVAPSTVTDWKAAVGYTPGNVYRVVKYVK